METNDPLSARTWNTDSAAHTVTEEHASARCDWQKLAQSLHQNGCRWNPKDGLGPPAKDGGVYRWGIAVASGLACDDRVELLSRLACGAKLPKALEQRVDLGASVRDWVATIAANASSSESATRSESVGISGIAVVQPLDAALAVLWAAALPALLTQLDLDDWLSLGETLEGLHEAVVETNDAASASHLIVAGELAWTLAMICEAQPCVGRWKRGAVRAINAWCRADSESISAAISGAVDARLVLASLVRCKRIMTAGEAQKLDKRAWKQAGQGIAHWVAAMTTQGGGNAFAPLGKSAVVDDCRTNGLLVQAAKFDKESLVPAVAAALGQTPSGGRLAWEVSLPEAMAHDGDAKLAVMMPQWDVRRGRMHVDYRAPQIRLELFAGRKPLVSGALETMLRVDGESQHPAGPWEEVCEYSDDDVHYLEIEQAWTGGCLLQRQLMLLREDRCVVFADAVLPKDRETQLGSIQYTCRFPVAEGVAMHPESETRELLLAAGGKRALLFPLAAGEWRVGPTDGDLAATEQGHVVMTGKAQRCLYAPLWIDLQQRRLKRKRTWRQLTVTDQLRIVGKDEAVGYRIQVGSEQWLVYRSLRDQRCRTVLGKHLIADFFCARFDAGDGSYEELITVDDNEASDE